MHSPTVPFACVVMTVNLRITVPSSHLNPSHRPAKQRWELTDRAFGERENELSEVKRAQEVAEISYGGAAMQNSWRRYTPVLAHFSAA